MNPAEFIDEKLTDFSYRVEEIGASIYDWLTDDWWFPPVIALAVLAGAAWLLTGGFDHFRHFPLR